MNASVKEKVLVKVARKAGLTAIGDVVGGVGAAVGGAMKGAGEAIGGGLKGLGEAVGGALRQPDVTINQMGLVGSAGQQSVKVVTGGGTLPSRKTVSKPSVNSKMPTEKLLQIAVGYLKSIDSSLKQQMDFQVQSSRELEQAQKEAEIEGKNSRFSEYADRFKAGVGNKVNAVKNSAMGTGANLLKIAGLGAAAAAALKLGSMDTKELDALKENLNEFENKFGWLFGLAGAGAAGFFIGGIKGLKAGVFASLIWESGLVQSVLRRFGLASEEDITQQGKYIKAAGDLGLGVVAAKKFMSLRKEVAEKVLELRTRPSGARYAAEIAKSAEYLKGFRWFDKLSSPVKRFITYLVAKMPKKVLTRVVQAIAGVAAGLATAETGVGAVYAFVSALVTVYSIYDLAKTIWDIYKEWSNQNEAENFIKENMPDADKAAGPGTAGSSTAQPAQPAQPPGTTQAVPQTAYDIVWANGAYGDPQRDAGKLLTQMTVDEVLDFQKNVLAPNTKAKQGTVHTPVGAYQFVYGTLKGYRDSGVVSGSDIFNAQTQDKLAENLWNSSRSGDMSKTWAYTFGSSPGQFANTSFESVKDKIISNEVGGYVGMTPSGPAAASKGIMSQSIDTIADIVKGMASIVNTKSTPISGGVAAISKANAGNEYVDRIQNQVALKENALRADIIQKQNDRQEPTARSAASLQIASANASNEYADRIQNQAISDEAALRGADQKQNDKRESAGRSTVGQRIAAANGGKMETLDPNYQVDPSNVISQYFIHFGLDA